MGSSVGDQLLRDPELGEHVLLKQRGRLLGCDGLVTGYEVDHLGEAIATDMSATDFSEWRKCSSRRLRKRREREEEVVGESGGLD